MRMASSHRMTKAPRATRVSALRGLRVHVNHTHAWLYSRLRGRLGGSVGGHRVLLLTTTGRRSGRERRTPVQYEALGNELVVVAAGGGSPSPPAWWLNLEADSEVEVQVGADRWDAYAETAGPRRRAELWPALIAANPSLESAQAKAGRQLPVVVLSRREPEPT
jgi:deazaflavin-dependent oxidoreductase (nitroreductase family)